VSTSIRRRVAQLLSLAVLALAAAVVVAAPAHASIQATYYVAPTGSDSNAGTLRRSFLTSTRPGRSSPGSTPA